MFKSVASVSKHVHKARTYLVAEGVAYFRVAVMISNVRFQVNARL